MNSPCTILAALEYTAQTRRRPEGRLGRPSDPWIWGNFRAILLEKVAVLHFQRKVV